MTITINSRNLNKKRKIDLLKINKVARSVLKGLDLTNAEVNIDFISNQKIRVLNRKYLCRDNSTDVLAFSSEDIFTGGKSAKKEKKSKNCSMSGDIAISSDRASSNAKLYGLSFIEELALYVIHGILHLAGYDDGTKKDKAIMRRKEDEFLQKAGRFL